MLNFEDSNGTDAVWLQASQSVCKLGHTGLLFEYKSKWYYWYWGIDPKAAIVGYLASLAKALIAGLGLIGTLYRVASTTVKAQAKLQAIGSKISSGNFKTTALREANKLYVSDTKFDKAFYIKGNFKGAYNYFSSLKKLLNYNLLFRNCMQTTVDGLLCGYFSKSNISKHVKLGIARCGVIPNLAYDYLKNVL